jgi:hypothetical protein
LSEYGKHLSRKIPDKATKSDADALTVDLDLILVNDNIELKEEEEEELDERARLPKVINYNCSHLAYPSINFFFLHRLFTAVEPIPSLHSLFRKSKRAPIHKTSEWLHLVPDKTIV